MIVAYAPAVEPRMRIPGYPGKARVKDVKIILEQLKELRSANRSLYNDIVMVSRGIKPRYTPSQLDAICLLPIADVPNNLLIAVVEIAVVGGRLDIRPECLFR